MRRQACFRYLGLFSCAAKHSVGRESRAGGRSTTGVSRSVEGGRHHLGRFRRRRVDRTSVAHDANLSRSMASRAAAATRPGSAASSSRGRRPPRKEEVLSNHAARRSPSYSCNSSKVASAAGNDRCWASKRYSGNTSMPCRMTEKMRLSRFHWSSVAGDTPAHCASWLAVIQLHPSAMSR